MTPYEDCAVDPSNYAVDPYYNEFVCQQCRAESYFSWEFDTGKQMVVPACRPCEDLTDNCEICNEDSTCRVCKEGFWPTPTGHYCQALIEDCDAEPQDYSIRSMWDQTYMIFDFFYKCPKCKEGFFWKEFINDSDEFEQGCLGECDKEIENCLECSLDGT